MIKARVQAEKSDANLKSYSETYKTFRWADVEPEFSWHATGKLNIVHEAVDRWTEDPEKADRTALIYEKAGQVQAFTYRELMKKSCQWADLLTEYGYQTGDRLHIILSPRPELYFAVLACARLGVIVSPLFPTLTFGELRDVLTNSEARGILTHPDMVERLPPDAMKSVKNIFLLEGPLSGLFEQEMILGDLPSKMPEEFQTRWVSAETPLYLLYSSGSTGPPKGVVHSHGDMSGHLITGRYVLDLREGTVLWTDGHPGWVTGTVYSIFTPLLCGAITVIQGAPFSASTWYRTLEQHRVEVWYTTPRTIRRLIEAGDDLPGRYDCSALRHICTVGETLPPELFYWVRKNMKLSPHDTWWMTETGMICIANYPSMDIKPGSMGKPFPGVEAAVVDENGEPLDMLTMGELALRPGWPAMMKEIRLDEARYAEYFRHEGWLLTGDMVIQDEDGYFYHQGRTDDLMKAGEKLVGPYEIEQLLAGHPEVKEAAVISKEGITGQPLLKAFVLLQPSAYASSRLIQELRSYVRANLSADITLNEIAFVEELPKTPSGKLLRRVLRAGELGLPGGDFLRLK
ncbi:MAG: AMP-binding protein [Pseudomonadota bacterium]